MSVYTGTYVETIERGNKPTAPMPVQVFTFEGDDKYATGGVALPTLDGTLLGGLPVVLSDGTLGFIDADNSKLMIGKINTGTGVWEELAAETSISSVTGTLVLFQY